jgi:hypothetical protein
MPSTTLPSRGRYPLWFGQVLPWSPTERGHETCYRGRRHEIINVTSRWARELGRGYHPGWHFTVHPESDGFVTGPGPNLGGRREEAQAMAEAWILAGESILKPGIAWAPSLDLALSGGGAGFGAGRSATTLAAYPDRPHAAVEIRVSAPPFAPPRSGELIGRAEVAFAAEDVAGVAAGDSPVTLTWTSRLADGRQLGTFPTWHEACAAVGATT